MLSPDQQTELAFLFTNLVQINRAPQVKPTIKCNTLEDMCNSKRGSIFSASTEASNVQDIPNNSETFNDLPPSESEDSSPESKKYMDESEFDFFAESDYSPVALNKKKENKVWGEDEDELLKKLGVVYKNDWKKIVKRFKVLKNIKKSPVFLMKRYKELIGNQGDTRRHFVHAEDLLIAECMEKFGTNWMEIAKHIPERGPITIKNRYYSYIKKNNLLEKLILEARSLREKEAPQELQEQKPIQPGTSEFLPEDAGHPESKPEEANFIEYVQEPAMIGFDWNEYQQSFERDIFGSSLVNDFDDCLRYY